MYNKEFENKLLDFLIKEEGLRLKAYQCNSKHWTIGIGNTFYQNNKQVEENDTITEQEAKELCLWYCKNFIDLKEFENKTDNQKISIISFQYNLGCDAFNKSTLKKYLLNNQDTLAKSEWVKWSFITINNVKQFNNSLFKRRERERNLYFGNIC